MNKAMIHIRFAEPGFHCWPDAPDHRAYLRSEHRHLFYVQVSTTVEHDEREIEFHDLQDQARQIFRAPVGSATVSLSCEAMARRLGEALVKKHGRAFTVEVWEDNECGATVQVGI